MVFFIAATTFTLLKLCGMLRFYLTIFFGVSDLLPSNCNLIGVTSMSLVQLKRLKEEK